MGWTGRFIGSHATLNDVKNEILNEFRGTDISVKYMSFKFNVAYVALEHDKTHEVTAFVTLWKFNKSSGELSTKVMNETEGPNERKATMKLLKMLTPTDSKYANEWRIECWKNFKTMPKEIAEDFKNKGFDLL